MFGLRKGWVIEPPPEQYASGPTQTGMTNEIPNLTPEMAHAMCQAAGTFSDKQQGYGVACYIPSLDAVVLPAAKYWPSKDELDQMRAHEWAHARGWRHNDDGTGTGPNSLPPVQAPQTAVATNAPASPQPPPRLMTGGN